MMNIFNELYGGKLTEINLKDNKLILKSAVNDIELISELNLSNKIHYINLNEYKKNYNVFKTAINQLRLHILVINSIDVDDLESLVNENSYDNIILMNIDGFHEDGEWADYCYEVLDKLNVTLNNWNLCIE